MHHSTVLGGGAHLIQIGVGGTSLHVHSVQTIAIQLLSAAKQSTRVAEQVKTRHWQHKPHHLSPCILKIVNKSYFQLLCQKQVSLKSY